MNNILLKLTVGILVFLGIASAFLWVSYTDMSLSLIHISEPTRPY